MPPIVKNLIIIVVLLLAAAGCGRQQMDIPDEAVNGQVGSDMDLFLTRLNQFGFHGSVLVAKGDSILLHKAYGIAQVPTGIKNHTSTLFSTGSVTKQFTAAAILKLEMDGALKTSDSLTRFFDNVPDDKVGITLHHLLTHSAGLSGDFGPDNENVGRDEYIRRVLDCTLSYPIGDHYEYSNAGYSVLAAVIEVVTGGDYETYLRDTFFNPLGMLHTGLKLIDVPDSLVSHSHNAEMKYVSPLDRPAQYYNLKGNGGIVSTTADMFRWYRSLRTNDILSKEEVRKLFTPYIKEYEDGDSYYGYGWVVQEYGPGDTMLWHNGGAMPQGWSCAVYNFKQDSLTCIVFSNATIEGALPVDDIVDNLSRIALGADYVMPPETYPMTIEELSSIDDQYLLGQGHINAVTEKGKLLIYPYDPAAVKILFPSPFDERLAQYSARTAEVIRLMNAGNFSKAAEYFHEEPGEHLWRLMLREWWQSFDSLGALADTKIIGTVLADGAHTYCRLKFKDKEVNCRLFWMAGKCGGLSTTETPLALELLPQSPIRYVGYSLKNSQVTTAELSEDGGIVLSIGGQQYTARRSKK